jgi:hypothetical protein
LHLTFAIEKAAASSVKGFVIFHDDNRGFDCIECRGSTFKQVPTGSDGIAHPVQVSFDHVIWNCPRATVYDKDGIAAQESLRKLVSVALCVE